jgi:hypothetical protein
MSLFYLLNFKFLGEKHFKTKIEKFVRRGDGAEIDDNDVLMEILNSDKELLLDALEIDGKS